MVVFSKLPVMMSDEDVVDKRYEEGKIYLIKCKYDDELVYVGSTIVKLGERFSKHKGDENCSLSKLVDGDWDNWYIELYEDYPCKNKYHLERREGEVQREIATINKNIAGRSVKEWYKDNRDKKIEKTKQYHQDNRDKRLQQAKKYRHDNSEKIKEKNKQYHQANRDDIEKKRKVAVSCDRCGYIVRKDGLKTHQRTQKCINHKNCV